ncbi:hypothetical protein AcW1_010112 [Taiwanofungus camphoratus]|nr:hypothetical protein AcV5_003006 [Antrodia cinnamomea]KAI0946733.1 hypothetical protein AcW1_010112 [Antrodia cinnamomea]KAI0954247.1 hypothetical protein AcV7_007527 [Antrodia cinnamomea]
MLSIIAQRVGLRNPALHLAKLRPLPLSTRPQNGLLTRTFLTTAYLAFADAQTSAKRATTGAKRGTASSKKVAAKAKRVAKSPATKTAKKPAKKPTEKTVARKPALAKMKISKEDLPPKRPASAWILYHQEYIKSRGRPKSPDELQSLAKEASVGWKALSDQEKQKYRDESESRLSAYHSSLEEYVKKVDPSIFKAINIQRKAKGQRRINTPAAVTSKIPKRPLSPYIQFTLEYRRNMTATPPSDLHGLDLGRWYSKQCGQQWKSMTEEQKKPYYEKYSKEAAEWGKPDSA